MLRVTTLVLLMSAVVLPADRAAAQVRIKLGKDLKPRVEFDSPQQDHRQPEHGDHRIDDNRNWVIRPHVEPEIEQLHRVIRPGATFVIGGGSSGSHRGSYYCHDDHYYYVPQRHHGHPAPRPVEVVFGSFTHVDELALQFETLMNEICLDLHYNYHHNYGFRETYAEAYQLLQAAKFVHAAEHRQDRQAIRAELGGVDALFHHVEDDVRGWSRHHHKQIGHGGIATKLEQAEATLHHLMHDVGVHAGPPLEQAPPPAGYVEQAPAPASQLIVTPKAVP